jgi:hypothetical protein
LKAECEGNAGVKTDQGFHREGTESTEKPGETREIISAQNVNELEKLVMLGFCVDALGHRCPDFLIDRKLATI